MSRTLIIILMASSLFTYAFSQDHHELIGGKVTDNYKSTVLALLGPAKCTATKIAPRT